MFRSLLSTDIFTWIWISFEADVLNLTEEICRVPNDRTQVHWYTLQSVAYHYWGVVASGRESAYTVLEWVTLILVSNWWCNQNIHCWLVWMSKIVSKPYNFIISHSHVSPPLFFQSHLSHPKLADLLNGLSSLLHALVGSDFTS